MGSVSNLVFSFVVVLPITSLQAVNSDALTTTGQLWQLP